MRPVKKNISDLWLNYQPGDTIKREHIQNGLIDTLGYYCSYCEMPLGGHEIEHHRHLKTWQKNVTRDHWNNLLLSCKDCRDHIAKEELSPAEKNNMLWPDEHATFTLDGKSPFVYQQREMRYMVFDHENNVHVDETKKLVFLTPNPAAGPEMYNKAKNTIDHFQLNMRKDYYTEGSNVMVVPYHHHHQRIDNRTFERTKAWEEAEASFNRLQQVSGHPDSQKFPQITEMMHDQISATSYFKGNWSVWMTVFNQLSPNNHALLHRLFLKDQRYFKGIDIDKLKLNL